MHYIKMAGRFQFLSENEMVHRISGRIPNNTARNTNWGANTWQAWASARNTARQLGQPLIPLGYELAAIDPTSLNQFLCLFVLEVRNKDGDLYPKDSLYNLCAALARYFKEDLGRPDLNFMNSNNAHFNRFKQCLDSLMKYVTELGIGSVKKQAKPISIEQERALWKKNILSMNTALGLSRVVYFYNCKVFGIRARDEHRNLQLEQYSFGNDGAGKYVMFKEYDRKYVSGGFNQQKVYLKAIKQYDNEQSLSVYKVFKRYFIYVGQSGIFYRRPLVLFRTFWKSNFGHNVIQ